MPLSISELARSASVERTKIYRLLDAMQDRGVVEIEVLHKRKRVRPADAQALRRIVAEKEAATQWLQQNSNLFEEATTRVAHSSSATQIQYYRGKSGIQQVLWNSLKATTPIYSYTFRILDEIVTRSFMDRWIERFIDNGLTEILVHSDDFVESWVGDNKDVGSSTGDRIPGFEYGYIAPEQFKISHSCDVYNDTVVYYNWVKGEVFAVEIKNKEIAETQRQFIKLLYAQTKPETRF